MGHQWKQRGGNLTEGTQTKKKKQPEQKSIPNHTFTHLQGNEWPVFIIQELKNSQ